MLSEADAVTIAREAYGLEVTASRLPGEYDDNFALIVDSHPHSVLKVSHAGERVALLALQGEILERLGESPASARYDFPRVLPTVTGNAVTVVPEGCPGAGRFLRLMTHVPGTHLAGVLPAPPPLLTSLGTLLATVDEALLDVDPPAARRRFAREGGDGDRKSVV